MSPDLRNPDSGSGGGSDVGTAQLAQKQKRRKSKSGAKVKTAQKQKRRKSATGNPIRVVFYHTGTAAGHFIGHRHSFCGIAKPRFPELVLFPAMASYIYLAALP